MTEPLPEAQPPPPPHPAIHPPAPQTADHHPMSPAPGPDQGRFRVITTTYDPARSRWGLGDALASITVYFAASVALVLFILAVVGEDEFLSGPWLPVGLVGPHVAMFAHISWVTRAKGTGLANDFRLRIVGPDIPLGFGLFVGALLIAGTTAFILEIILGEPPVAAAIEVARESSDGGGITIWLCLFALLGATFVPVVEELVYRGLLWSALEKRGVRPWMILVGTSAFFAIVHLEPARTPVLFIIGLALGLGRLWTGRIGASILTHVFINALAMLATIMELA